MLLQRNEVGGVEMRQRQVGERPDWTCSISPCCFLYPFLFPFVKVFRQRRSVFDIFSLFKKLVLKYLFFFLLKINGIDLCTLILSSHTSRYHATEWKYFLLEVRHHDPMNHKASETSVIIIMTSQKQPHALLISSSQSPSKLHVMSRYCHKLRVGGI